jgi:hypothetical protein
MNKWIYDTDRYSKENIDRIFPGSLNEDILVLQKRSRDAWELVSVVKDGEYTVYYWRKES